MPRWCCCYGPNEPLEVPLLDAPDEYEPYEDAILETLSRLPPAGTPWRGRLNSEGSLTFTGKPDEEEYRRYRGSIDLILGSIRSLKDEMEEAESFTMEKTPKDEEVPVEPPLEVFESRKRGKLLEDLRRELHSIGVPTPEPDHTTDVTGSLNSSPCYMTPSMNSTPGSVVMNNTPSYEYNAPVKFQRSMTMPAPLVNGRQTRRTDAAIPRLSTRTSDRKNYRSRSPHTFNLDQNHHGMISPRGTNLDVDFAASQSSEGRVHQRFLLRGTSESQCPADDSPASFHRSKTMPKPEPVRLPVPEPRYDIRVPTSDSDFRSVAESAVSEGPVPTLEDELGQLLDAKEVLLQVDSHGSTEERPFALSQIPAAADGTMTVTRVYSEEPQRGRQRTKGGNRATLSRKRVTLSQPRTWDGADNPLGGESKQEAGDMLVTSATASL